MQIIIQLYLTWLTISTALWLVFCCYLPDNIVAAGLLAQGVVGLVIWFVYDGGLGLEWPVKNQAKEEIKRKALIESRADSLRWQQFNAWVKTNRIVPRSDEEFETDMAKIRAEKQKEITRKLGRRL